MTIAVPPRCPTSVLILGSCCCISDSDGAISPTVSSVSTAYTVSLGCAARRSPGSSTSPLPPQLLSASKLEWPIVISSRAITVLDVQGSRRMNRKSQLLSTRRGAQNSEWRLALYDCCRDRFVAQRLYFNPRLRLPAHHHAGWQPHHAPRQRRRIGSAGVCMRVQSCTRDSAFCTLHCELNDI